MVFRIAMRYVHLMKGEMRGLMLGGRLQEACKKNQKRGAVEREGGYGLFREKRASQQIWQNSNFAIGNILKIYLKTRLAQCMAKTKLVF